jgi:DNA topoisomerase-2
MMIYSSYDPDRGLRYKQTWSDHMARVSEPLIEAMEASAARPASSNSSDSAGYKEAPFGPDFDGRQGFTRVSFVPDLRALSSPRAESDAADGTLAAASRNLSLRAGDLAALRRRAVEMAGCLASQGVKVRLEGALVPVASFAGFADLFAAPEAAASAGPDEPARPAQLAVAEVGGDGRWEIAVCPASALRSSASSDAEASSSSGGHVSFVNGMATPRGGTHIAHAVAPLVKALAEAMAKRNPELGITPALVKQLAVVFVSAQIENPTFDSQMKECLTTRAGAFGSAYVPSKAFVKKILENTCLEAEVLEVAQRRSLKELNKKKVGGGGGSKKPLNVPKLDDAYYAGSSKALSCTLILTEGDSAKALAVAGLEVVGRDNFGVFPLRGKLLNARDATKAQLMKNAELMALCSILNLDFRKQYNNGPDSSMRYGSVMIMADQDHDGSHIKGLVVNFFHKFWPALLQCDGFLQQFATPVLKATPLKASKKAAQDDTVSFYSLGDFDRWRAALADKAAAAAGAAGGSSGVPAAKSELDKWRIKYYKGLGTSTAAEAKAYFTDLEQHRSRFVWRNHPGDGGPDTDADVGSNAIKAYGQDANDLIDLVFSKRRAQDRKAWLLAHRAPLPLPPQQPTVSYCDFVNRELVHFSHADNVRSIPSVVDGLKPSQRKLLYACFKRKLTEEVKVAQLSG